MKETVGAEPAFFLVATPLRLMMSMWRCALGATERKLTK
jgi:hypothetical protein